MINSDKDKINFTCLMESNFKEINKMKMQKMNRMTPINLSKRKETKFYN